LTIVHLFQTLQVKKKFSTPALPLGGMIVLYKGYYSIFLHEIEHKIHLRLWSLFLGSLALEPQLLFKQQETTVL
jgi:hypothetical protein